MTLETLAGWDGNRDAQAVAQINKTQVTSARVIAIWVDTAVGLFLPSEGRLGPYN